MSRFKKEIHPVREAEQIPDSIHDAIFGKPVALEDKYAALQANAQQRQAQIARETAGYQNAPDVRSPHVWETVRQAETYRQPRFAPQENNEEVDFNQFFPEDVHNGSVRRVGAGVDNGDSTRNIRLMSISEGRATIDREATLFDPYRENLEEMLMGSMAEHTLNKVAARRSKVREQRHKDWEEEQMHKLSRRSVPVTARAHQVVRTHVENVAAGRFGIIDRSYLDEREQERLAMQENRRKERMSIQRHAKTRSERHQEWEEAAREKLEMAQESQHYVSDWADELLRLAQFAEE